MSKHRWLLLAVGFFLMTTAVFAQVGSIDGIVQLPNNGGPAVGATVTIHRMFQDSLSTTTDSAGHFNFRAVAFGEWGVRAFLSPYMPAFAVAHVRPNETAHVALNLMNPPTGYGRVEGIVLFPNTGGPAAGATVVLFRAHGDSLVTVSDDSGHFAFDSARAGEHDIHASLAGYLTAYARVFVPDGATGRIALILRPIPTGYGRVEGIVLFPNAGGPAAGATVVLFRAHGDSLVTVSDDSGHFAFDSARAGEHDIHASLAGYLTTYARVFVPDGGTGRIALVLRTVGGRVEGLVTRADQTPVSRALVRMFRHGEPRDYHAETNADGHFVMEHVQAGAYTITAMALMHGFARAEITVADSQLTQVTLVLNDSMNGGHHHGDTLATVHLRGIAIVVYPDSIHHPRRAQYFMDVNSDGRPDYRLAFGPPWYEPPTVPPIGPRRPANGDTISIFGGLLTFAAPPTVVVYEINGMFWRAPFRGHGGHGGGDHGHDGCTPDSVTRVELAGAANVRGGDGFHNDHTVYALSENDRIIALLDFGRPDYDPGNGAVRPANGDRITIVGGQVYCPNAQIPLVIVYEINGLFWREPGDTLGLGSVTPESVNEPVPVGAPLTYLTARNYPNPFNPVTTIQYSIPVSGSVNLTVYDLEGREVATLVNTSQTAGTYAVAWDGSNTASGIYFYRITAGGQVFTNRMLLLK